MGNYKSDLVTPCVPFWPIEALEPERPMWKIASGQVTGGQNLEGWGQTGIFGGGGFWYLQLGRIVVSDEPDQHLTWVALQALLDSGAAPFIVRYPDFAAYTELAGSLAYSSFCDRASFSDGGLFVTTGSTVLNEGAAAINATSLTAVVVSGPPPQAGMVFSVLDDQGLPRRHAIRAVTAIDGYSQAYTIKFRPWLRAALVDGAELDFGTPGCVMKLKDPDSIFADALGGRFAEVSPVLDEWFGTIP